MQPLPFCLVVVLAAANVLAQQPQVPFAAAAVTPPGLFQPLPFAVGSGARVNPGSSPSDVWSDGVVVPWATSLVVHFSIAELGSDDDWIEVHGLADRETQILDRTRLKQWRNESARFNGGVVVLTLHLAPGSTGRIEVDLVHAGATPAAPDTICGPLDDRVLSSDARVCRLVFNNSSVCTGWLVGTTSTIATAGHCGWGGVLTSYRAEFNVPLSLSSGTPLSPPVADQFPVDVPSAAFETPTAIGTDWAVVRLHPNSSGEQAFARQGASFPLATSLPNVAVPFLGPTIRVTGFGTDFGAPNFAQQTDTGALDIVSGDAVLHHADTEGGVSGAPVILESSGRVIAIHTNGGCDTSLTSSNGATSILRSALQSAIGNVGGCASVSLVDGTPATITCANTIYNITPVAAKWNVVGVSSTSDWEIEMDGVGSSALTDTCDFLLANGHFGALPPRSGRMFRATGSTTARGQVDAADTLTVGTSFNTSWDSSSIVRIYEFDVAAAGTFDVGVFGDPALSWRLYSPGLNAAWRSLGSSTLVASGGAGGNVANNVILGTGFHALVVSRDGNAGAPSPSQLTITVCAATTALVLFAGVETTVNNTFQEFSITPGANVWNAVAVGAAPGTTLEAYLGAGQSRVGGTSTNFVLADGNQGAIGTSRGLFERSVGTGSATAVHVNATALSLGGQFDTSLSTGEVLDLFEFNVATAGNFTVTVTGGAGAATLFWRVYAPQAGTQWITRSDLAGGGTVGGASLTMALGTGVHALAVFVNGAPVTASHAYGLSVCPAVATLSFATSGTATIAASCQTFQFTSNAGRWHAIGLSSAATSNWDLGIGEAESELTSGSVDFLVANGSLGTVSPTAGLAVRETGSDPGQLDYDGPQSIALGASALDAMLADEIIEIFELSVATADEYDLAVTGPATFKWALFAPGTSAAWLPRSSAFQSGTVPGGTTVSLTPGLWAIAIFREVPAATGEIFTVTFALTPNPAPVLATIAPNSTISLGAGFTLTANGSDFIPESVVHWSGSPLTTAFVSANQLTASVPASLIATAGIHAVTVVTPAPGGGTSSAQSFTVNNPVPVISALSPSTAIAGVGLSTFLISGSDFRAPIVALWDGAVMNTVLLSPTLLRATPPLFSFSNAGTVAVSVFTLGPGGGSSGSLTFTINNPVPGLVSIAPSSATAGGPTFTLSLSGASFRLTSVARWNGTGLATTFVSAGTLQATVPAALIASGGTASVTVFTPAPGGGTSVVRTFTINNLAPSLASLVPNIAVAGSPPLTVNANGSNFVASSVVEVNGTPVPTSFMGPGQVQATIPAALLGTPGVLAVTVRNPAPGGGASGSVNFGLLGTALLAVSPALIAPMTPASPPFTVTSTGLNFLPTAVIHANGTPLPTTFVNSTTLTASIGPAILQTQRPGGIAIHVANSATAISNGLVIEVGAWDNDGIISRRPLNPAPGGTYAAFLEDVPPNSLFSLYVDADNVVPVGPFVDATMNNVLAVSSYAGSSMSLFLPLVESFGLFGPANPVATSPQGTFTLPGIVLPNPAVGLNVTVQGLYLDPTAPYGIRLTWARFPDSF